MDPTSPSGWHRKQRYHHRDLAQSALRRGREVVALRGPSGLTLRGLARDLGVTAPALVYHFGSVAGLRAAVAESVVNELPAVCGIGHDLPRRTHEEIGADWIAFAAANANLYRLASGEGWHRQPTHPNGYQGHMGVRSPRLMLEETLRRQTRRHGKPKGDIERSRCFAFTIHGLALARLDGVPEGAVAQALGRAVAAAA